MSDNQQGRSEISNAHRITSQMLKDKLTTLDLSPIKRERQVRDAKEKERKKMRDALPVLTVEEIRRHRLPYHEAIITELESMNRPNAAIFLRQLLAYQESFRQQHGPDTVVWNRPQLYKSKQHMQRLFNGLSTAEMYNAAGDEGAEFDELAKLAVYYAFGPDDWWWLGTQLMQQLRVIGETHELDGGRRRALAYFFLGKFFVDNMSDPTKAQKYLNTCRILSMGTHWNPSRELGQKTESLYVETCVLLYKALMTHAEQMDDMHEAIKKAMIARKRAAEACYHEGEAQALLFKGRTERLLGDTREAIATLQKALHVQLKHEQPEGICEARVQLALAYLRDGDTAAALYHLQELMEYAQAKQLAHYIAEAYRYLGMHHASTGQPGKATPLLIKALVLFHQQHNLDNLAQVRNFAAISYAQEMLPAYTRLLVKSDGEGGVDEERMRKLLEWKNVRGGFWPGVTPTTAATPSGPSDPPDETSLPTADSGSTATTNNFSLDLKLNENVMDQESDVHFVNSQGSEDDAASGEAERSKEKIGEEEVAGEMEMEMDEGGQAADDDAPAADEGTPAADDGAPAADEGDPAPDDDGVPASDADGRDVLAKKLLASVDETGAPAGQELPP